MRLWSNNLYKAGWVVVGDSTRVIDSNERMESRLKKAAAEGYQRREDAPEDSDGFTSGLNAAMVDALLSPDGQSAIVKAGSAEETREAIDEELETARAELAQVKEEAAGMLDEARAQIEVMRRNAMEEASEQGFQEGYQKGMEEVREMERACQARREELEAEYQQKIEELEPEFIDALTGIYEHIFKVDLSGYRQIVANLLIDALQKTGSASSYIIHVSKKDYPQVMREKKRILEESGTSTENLEIISDMTLSESQCMIETEAGVYDCSLETELKELCKKLRLLSYKK